MTSVSHPALRASAAPDPYAGAKKCKAGGGVVVGYMTANAPIELIEAAGMYPLRLDGRGLTSTPQTDQFMESLFDPTVRGVCEDLIAGRLDFIDALVLPRTSDSVQRLYYYLCEQKRLGVVRLPELIFYDLLHTPFYSSAEHNFVSLSRVGKGLVRLGGKPITDKNLANAIAHSNKRADILAQCLSADLTGVERFNLVTHAERLPASDFLEMAAQLTSSMSGRDHGAAPRIVFAGNAPDTSEIYEAIEGLGCVIVADYHDRAGPIGGARIDASLPPLRAISEFYHRHTASPRKFPTQPSALLNIVEERRAQAVVFFYYAQEEVLTWDYPAARDLLAARGYPSLCLDGQRYDVDAGAVARAIQPFLAGLSPHR